MDFTDSPKPWMGTFIWLRTDRVFFPFSGGHLTGIYRYILIYAAANSYKNYSSNGASIERTHFPVIRAIWFDNNDNNEHNAKYINRNWINTSASVTYTQFTVAQRFVGARKKFPTNNWKRNISRFAWDYLSIFKLDGKSLIWSEMLDFSLFYLKHLWTNHNFTKKNLKCHWNKNFAHHCDPPIAYGRSNKRKRRHSYLCGHFRKIPLPYSVSTHTRPY